ncbi:MAG: hypothetical protein IJ680_03975, partial [Paludibacteraceae bacterium]|nr:hypothetical protein [Paludibacteraceae bacterium]
FHISGRHGQDVPESTSAGRCLHPFIRPACRPQCARTHIITPPCIRRLPTRSFIHPAQRPRRPTALINAPHRRQQAQTPSRCPYVHS